MTTQSKVRTRVLSVVCLFAVGVASLLICTQTGMAQSVPLALLDKNQARALEDYYRDRIIRVTIGIREKSTNSELTIYGNAFLISDDGYAASAGHVMKYITDDRYELSRAMVFERADGGSLKSDIKLVDNSLVISTRADIALFRIATESGQQLPKHVCVEFADIRLDPTKTVTTAAWRFFDTKTYKRGFRMDAETKITSIMGPGPLAEYWEVNTPFDNSMSGGPVLKHGRVVGVIAAGLEKNGKPLQGANYVSLLQFADDLNLQARASRCVLTVPNQRHLVRFDSQAAFMGSDEGTVALVPHGSKGLHWGLVEGGNYGIRRDDLPCDPSIGCGCSGRQRPDTGFRFVINHGSASGTKTCESDGRLGLGDKTFYGVQVVPIFRDDVLDTIRPQLWLFRNAKLLERSANGSFNSQAGEIGKPFTKKLSPADFNKMVQASEEIRVAGRGCGSRLRLKECVEVLRVSHFKSKLGPWHGYPRDQPRPQSTVANPAQDWSVPTLWAERAPQVRNWILRYRGTSERKSKEPVTFSFCATDDWKGFYVRVFSPERCVDGQYFRIHLQD